MLDLKALHMRYQEAFNMEKDFVRHGEADIVIARLKSILNRIRKIVDHTGPTIEGEPDLICLEAEMHDFVVMLESGA